MSNPSTFGNVGGSGGSGGVSSVTSSNGYIGITPTTGAVVVTFEFSDMVENLQMQDLVIGGTWEFSSAPVLDSLVGIEDSQLFLQYDGAGGLVIGDVSNFYADVTITINQTSGITLNSPSAPISLVGDVSFVDLITSYNGVATTLFGVAPIIASGNVMGRTTTLNNLTTFVATSPLSVFRITTYQTINSVATDTLTVTVTFTDQNANSATLTLTPTPLGATGHTSYTGMIWAHSGNIGVNYVVTGAGSINYDAFAEIEELD